MFSKLTLPILLGISVNHNSFENIRLLQNRRGIYPLWDLPGLSVFTVATAAK
jgi:hypothetical protein